MPSTVQEHYDSLLAEHYDWMFGVPLESKVAEQKMLLHEILGSETRRTAVDLGCGSGLSITERRVERMVTMAASKPA